jgi:hypothetical protein
VEFSVIFTLTFVDLSDARAPPFIDRFDRSVWVVESNPRECMVNGPFLQFKHSQAINPAPGSNGESPEMASASVI